MHVAIVCDSRTCIDTSTWRGSLQPLFFKPRLWIFLRTYPSILHSQIYSSQILWWYYILEGGFPPKRNISRLLENDLVTYTERVTMKQLYTDMHLLGTVTVLKLTSHPIHLHRDCNSGQPNIRPNVTVALPCCSSRLAPSDSINTLERIVLVGKHPERENKRLCVFEL